MKFTIFLLLLVFAQGVFIHAGDIRDGYSQVPNGYRRRMTVTDLTADTIQIQFKASWTAKRYGIERAVLLGAAKEASKRGFDYFKFVDFQDEGLVLKKEVIAAPGQNPEYFTCNFPDTSKMPRGFWKFFIKCFKTKSDKDAMDSKMILTFVTFQ
jgi:hypothetical protein